MSDTRQTLALQEVADLMRPGQPLPFCVLDAHGRLLLAEGQPVHDAQQLRALLDRGACVIKSEADAVRAARQGDAAPGGRTYAARQLTWFDRWERHLWAIDDVLRELAKGGASAEQLLSLATQQMALVRAQPDAAIFTLMRQDDQRYALYALSHARHAALAVQLASGLLGWNATRTLHGVAAALTMNACTVELQAQMAEQKEPPTRRQLDQLRAHPQRSAELLRAAGVAHDEWLQAVEQHHEKPGGGGYPADLHEPTDMARLVRAADVYTAKVSPRAFRAPLASQQAARQLFQDEAGGPIAGALIKAMGVFPPGDWVRLKNGETGLVVLRAGGAAGAAQVAVLQSPNGKTQPGTTRRDTAQPEHQVARQLTPEERAALPRVLPEQVYGLLQAAD